MDSSPPSKKRGKEENSRALSGKGKGRVEAEEESTVRKTLRRIASNKVPPSPFQVEGTSLSMPIFKHPHDPAGSTSHPPVDLSYETSIFSNIQSFLRDKVNKDNICQIAPEPLLKAVECNCSLACLHAFSSFHVRRLVDSFIKEKEALHDKYAKNVIEHFDMGSELRF